MITIALDAGHGGTDPGASGYGITEKDTVLKVVRMTKEHLEKNYEGVKVLETRPGNVSRKLDTRTDTANKAKCASLVSVHNNAGGKEDAKLPESQKANGYEDFVYSTDGADSKSHALQQAIHKQLSPLWTGKGRRNRGMKKANFHMVREFKGAAVLVELGFMSSETDSNLLKDEAFLKQNAIALAVALADYHNLKKKVVSKPVVKPKPTVKPVAKPKPTPAVKPPAKASSQKYAYITVSVLNVRAEGHHTAKITDVVRKGSKFTVKRVLPNGWVQFISGGYVNGDYVRFSSK
jgi:N-acetylmuramoyl-L-alanine amidase